MLILKQNAANTVPTPPAGKGTIFLDDSDVLSVKTSDGNVENFPTTAASNSQVVFMNGTSLSGEAALTYDFNNNILTVTGNVAAGNVKTDNLLYANGTAWDLSDPGGSNTQIQFNDDESFGGSAALTFNKSSNLVTISGNANIGNIGTAQVLASANVTAPQLISNVSTGTAPLVVTSTTQVANLSVATAGTAGTVTSAAQSNITSVGTLTSLAVTGNITSGNISTDGVFSGNAAGASSLVFGNITTLSTAGITTDELYLQATTRLAVTASGSSGYVFDQYGAGLNPTLYARSGDTLAFNLAVTGHPFLIRLSGANYSTGLNHVTTAGVVTTDTSAQGQTTGTLYWKIPYGITGNYQYQCSIHGGMLGNIVIADSNLANVSVATASTVTTAAQSNITSVGTLTSLAVTGNITSGNVYANSGTVGASLLTGTLTTSAQPNITSLGTLTGLGVNGNITAANITANTGVFTGNGSGLSAIAGANVTGQVGNALVAGTVYTNAQPNITSVGTLTSLGVTGNLSSGNANLGNAVTANFFIGSGNNLSNIQGANVTGTVATATTAGTVTTAAQPNITSVGTLTSLGVSGNITAANITANTGVFTGNGSGLSAIAGANVTGTVANATFATSAGTAATVTTAAQPNITSVGTLTGLGVNGNITAANITANTGVFTGNGSGLSAIAGANVTGTVANATFATSAGTAATVTTAAQPNITSVGTLTGIGVNGTITGVNITANTGVFTGNGSGLSAIAGANVTGAVAFATTANAVAGANVSGAVAFATTANAVAGSNVSGTVSSATTAGTVTTAAQPNITSVGTLTSVSVTGNVAAGNLTTTGILSVTGTGVSSIAGNLDMTSNTITNLATPTSPNDAATKQYVDDVAQGLHTHDSCNAATSTTLATASGGTVTYNNGTDGVGATLTTTGTYTTIDGVTLSNGMRILVKNEANTAHNGIYDRTSTTVLTRSTDFDTPTEMAGGDFTFISAGTLYDNTGWVMPDPVTTVGTTAVTFVQFSGAGTFTAGTGLTLTGNEFSVNASQTQVTSVGTLTGLAVNGNITAANITANTGVFTGNGSALTALNASNVSSGTLAQARLANSNVILGSTTLALGTTTTTIAGLSSVTSTTFVGALTGAATTAGTVTSAAQSNITSVGTLTGLGVNGNITAANITANTGVFTGNGSGLSAIAGANVTGTVANATFATSAGTAGTVTTAAQGNITSVGTLTGLGVNGTITGVNITANTGVFTGNGSGLSAIAGANVTGTVSSATTAGTVTTAAQPNITSVGTLSSLSVTGNANTGNLGTTTLIATTGNITTINSGLLQNGNSNIAITANGNVSIQAAGSTVELVVTSTGANISGTLNATGNANVGNIGAAAGVFTTVSGNGSALSSITGANVTGTVANATFATSADSATTAGTVTTAAQGNITSVGTLTSLGVSGTITAANITANTGVFTGNGSGLSAIAGANVTGTVANATFATSAGSATTAGTVTTAAQPNITSVGTLTSLGVSGTITAANITANTGVFTGNGSALTALNASNVSSGTLAQARLENSNVILGSTTLALGSTTTTIAGLSSVTSTTFVGALTGAATTAGSVTTAAQGNITSVGTLTSLGVSGTITAANITANTGFIINSVNAAVSAAGTVQANATALTRELNVTSTVASGAGVKLPTAIAGMRITIINTAANAVLVYPETSGIINSLAANAAYSQPAGAKLDFVATSTTQWYTLNATYG